MEKKKESSEVRPQYVELVAAPKPVGPIGIVSDGNVITRIEFESRLKRSPLKEQPQLLKEAARQMAEYLKGQRRDFDLPLEKKGTAFQSAVWRALLKVPYGKSKTYGDVAEKIGRPKAFRAVGNAVGKNPFPIVIPCHRIVASGGIGGFSGGSGLPVKRWLRDRESAY